jgi:hypothetical protein
MIANLNRRKFLRNTVGAAIGARFAPGALQAAPGSLPEKMIGIQVGSALFLDEGTGQVPDIFRSKGAVNTIFLTTFTSPWADSLSGICPTGVRPC